MLTRSLDSVVIVAIFYFIFDTFSLLSQCVLCEKQFFFFSGENVLNESRTSHTRNQSKSLLNAVRCIYTYTYMCAVLHAAKFPFCQSVYLCGWYGRCASVQIFPNFHVESNEKPPVNAILLECTR